MRLISIFILATALFAQSPSTFETHLAAGQAAMAQSRYSEADAELHAAVAETATPDPNRSPARVVDTYSTLCDLDLMLGRFDEAITLAFKASAAVEEMGNQAKLAGQTPPELTPHLARLAGAYRFAGKTPLAVPVLQRMLSIDLAAAPDNPNISSDYDKIGSAYMELGQMEDSRIAYEKALNTRIGRLGPDHLDVATSWVNLGVLEVANTTLSAAQKDFESALAISEKQLGAESYALTGILDRLGELFSKEQRFSQAEPMFQRSLAIREKTLGPRHFDVAQALDDLGSVYYMDKKFAEAEPVFQRELQIWTATQGEASPLVAQALDNLGSVYAAQKRLTDAEVCFKKALAIREARDIDSLSNLAQIYESTGDLKRSDDYFQRAILIGDKGLGSDHPEVVTTMDEYAKMLHAAGRLVDAKKMEARLKDLKDRLNPQVTSSVAGVAMAASGATGGTGSLPAPVRKQ